MQTGYWVDVKTLPIRASRVHVQGDNGKTLCGRAMRGKFLRCSPSVNVAYVDCERCLTALSRMENKLSP